MDHTDTCRVFVAQVANETVDYIARLQPGVSLQTVDTAARQGDTIITYDGSRQRRVNVDNLLYHAFLAREEELPTNLWLRYGMHVVTWFANAVARVARGRAAALLATESDVRVEAARVVQSYNRGHLNQLWLTPYGRFAPMRVNTVVRIGEHFYTVVEVQQKMDDMLVYLDRALGSPVLAGETVYAGLEKAQVSTLPGGVTCVFAPQIGTDKQESARGLQANWRAEPRDRGLYVTINLLFGVIVDETRCTLIRQPANKQPFIGW